MKRKIICEIDVPEDFDACWNDGCGIQAFHETIVVSVFEKSMSTIIQISQKEKSNQPEDIRVVKYLKTKQFVRDSLKVVGYVDSNGNTKELEEWQREAQ